MRRKRQRLARRPGVRGLRATGDAAAILVLAASLAASAVGSASGQGGTGSNAAAAVEPEGPSATIEETLGGIGRLITRLDASASDARARAEDILDLADAATDPDEQLRLEELYGRTAALAQSFEEQASRLRTLRDELAIAAGKIAQ